MCVVFGVRYASVECKYGKIALLCMSYLLFVANGIVVY